MPSRSNPLTQETLLVKELRVFALPELVCAKAVAVRREGLHVRLQNIGLHKPLVGVQIVLYALDLLGEGLGDEEVGAVREVFEEAGGVEEA